MVGFLAEAVLVEEPVVVEVDVAVLRPEAHIGLIEGGQLSEEHPDAVQVAGLSVVEHARVRLLVPEVVEIARQHHLPHR